MAGHKSSGSRVRRESLRISSIERRGWTRCLARTPGVGETVYTVDGRAEVVRILGRVSDGSRLLELRPDEQPAPPFFAAASNVLVAATDAGTVPAEDVGVWLGEEEGPA